MLQIHESVPCKNNGIAFNHPHLEKINTINKRIEIPIL